MKRMICIGIISLFLFGCWVMPASAMPPLYFSTVYQQPSGEAFRYNEDPYPQGPSSWKENNQLTSFRYLLQDLSAGLENGRYDYSCIPDSLSLQPVLATEYMDYQINGSHYIILLNPEDGYWYYGEIACVVNWNTGYLHWLLVDPTGRYDTDFLAPYSPENTPSSFIPLFPVFQCSNARFLIDPLPDRVAVPVETYTGEDLTRETTPEEKAAMAEKMKTQGIFSTLYRQCLEQLPELEDITGETYPAAQALYDAYQEALELKTYYNPMPDFHYKGTDWSCDLELQGTVYGSTLYGVISYYYGKSKWLALCGDVNGDGGRTVTDVVLQRKNILEGGNVPEDAFYRSDVNQDKILSVTDVVLLRKGVLSGMESVLQKSYLPSDRNAEPDWKTPNTNQALLEGIGYITLPALPDLA